MYSSGPFLINDYRKWDIPTTIRFNNIKLLGIMGVAVNLYGTYSGDGVVHSISQLKGVITFYNKNDSPIKYDLDKTLVAEEIVTILNGLIGFDVEYRAFLRHESEKTWFEDFVNEDLF